jgi:hypothetical protein
MKFATTLVVCLALLAVPAVQARQNADPLTGTWKGTMGPNESQQRAIQMDLKYDGKTITGVITGPQTPADITKGSFDATTGALTMEAVVRNDRQTAVAFTAKVVKDTASGTVAFDNNSGTFSIKKDAPAK